MSSDMFERMRTKLFGGHTQNPLAQLLKDRAAVGGSIQGTPEEFSQVLFELTGGDLGRRNGPVSYEAVGKVKKNILKFRDGSLFRVVKTKGKLGDTLIVITPHLPSMDDLVNSVEMPLSRLVSEVLVIREAYTHVANEYRQEERKLAAERAAEEARMSRESRLDTVLEIIEKATSSQTVMVRGQQNIDALVRLGFIPGLVDNPDNWIDAEDFPGMRYRHARSGVEVILTGREKFRPIEELSRLEFTFLVNRSDDDPAAFARMVKKFRREKRDGTPYAMKEFHDDLISLVKYPDELKYRTEEDLGLMADEVGHVIDRRQVLDKGILPYEAVFKRDTGAIIDYIRQNGTPAREIRKALDYFEYTGMIDGQYKTTLYQQLEAAIAPRAADASAQGDVLSDRRVKEIVSEVLKKIPRERLTPRMITIALTPYVGELGFSKLVKIRERILQLKEMVRGQEEYARLSL